MYDEYIVIIVPRRRLTVEEIHERYHGGFEELFMRSFEKRLSMLEGANLSDIAIVERWVRAGRFYDELTDAEKELYQKYRESLGGGADDIAGAHLKIWFNDTPPEIAFHFPLSRRKRPPTQEELAKRVQEVQKIFDDLKNDYDDNKE